MYIPYYITRMNNKKKCCNILNGKYVNVYINILSEITKEYVNQ